MPLTLTPYNKHYSNACDSQTHLKTFALRFVGTPVGGTQLNFPHGIETLHSNCDVISQTLLLSYVRCLGGCVMPASHDWHNIKYHLYDCSSFQANISCLRFYKNKLNLIFYQYFLLQEYRRMGHEWKIKFCHSSLLKKMIIISGEIGKSTCTQS